jgi:hypothetical protein
VPPRDEPSTVYAAADPLRVIGIGDVSCTARPTSSFVRSLGPVDLEERVAFRPSDTIPAFIVTAKCVHLVVEGGASRSSRSRKAQSALERDSFALLDSENPDDPRDSKIIGPPLG